MTISLCMIVKDEAENLPRCLESVKDCVDEMRILDTGSQDDTIAIAASYGAI
ncbi:MAG: glycosyltransferase, partial [Cyanobacteria bacterium P01_H01_bin.152]